MRKEKVINYLKEAYRPVSLVELLDKTQVYHTELMLILKRLENEGVILRGIKGISWIENKNFKPKNWIEL